MNNQEWRAFITEAIRYWERSRIWYNATLVFVVLAVFLLHAAAFVQHISIDTLLRFFLLAVVANVAYCAAYPVDLLAQYSEYRGKWLRVRWILLVIGTLFASVIAQLFARGAIDVN